MGASPLIAQTPVLTKAFIPDTIGPGSTSRLTFTVTNDSSNPVTDIQFEDILPEGVTIATPADVSTECEGQVSAPDRGTTIQFTGGRLAANSFCTVSVNVTSSIVATHSNTSGDLMTSAGNSPGATADLIVTTDRPGFTKSFNPDAIAWGGRSTLTFTLDHSAGSIDRASAMFTDVLPDGLVVADPPNVVSDCGGVVTAEPGSNVISYTPTVPGFDPMIKGGETCSISVDVIGESIGTFHNQSGELSTTVPPFFDEESSGFAVATLTVSTEAISIRKSFLDDPVPPGGTTELEYTITNRSRAQVATDIRFTDDLNATLEGLLATSPTQNDLCGSGSSLSGTSLITFTGGRLEAGESCTFKVEVQVPTNASSGLYPSTTSSIAATLGGSIIEGNSASDTLTVSPVPELTMELIDDTTTAGGSVIMTFSIKNASLTSPASDLAFTWDLPSEFSEVNSQPENGFCGPLSIISVFPLSADSMQLAVSGGSLNAGETCVFQIGFDINPSTNSGVFSYTTSAITATIDGESVTGAPANEDLIIVSAPRLTMDYLEDVILPGETATLRFTLEHNQEAQQTATNIGFSVDMSDATTTGLPQNDLCGPGSSLTGTSVITFAGGTLEPGQTCSFDVDVLFPENAPIGTIENTSSSVSAIIDGIAVGSASATAELLISTLSFEKLILDESVLPGGTTKLEFTIRNNGETPATKIRFSDDLNAMLEGLTAVGLPKSDICGTGSVLSGTTELLFTGGQLDPGETCTFEVDLQVPAEAIDGRYNNATSDLQASIGGQEAVLPPAAAALEINSLWLEIRKAFIPNPAIAGSTTRLEFTIVNLHPTNAVQDISFTDELLSGLAYEGAVLTDIFGDGSQLSGTTTLTFRGGSLEAGDACTFSLPIQVPDDAPESILNTTSDVMGLMDDLSVRGDAASDNLSIFNLDMVAANTLGPPAFNLNDNLIRQQVEVTNSNAFAVSGFRLLITNIPEDVTVENATGIDGERTPFIDWLHPIQPDETVLITIEFLRSSGNADFDPVYQLEFLTASSSPPTQVFELTDVELFTDGTLLLEWTVKSERLYCIEWSDDLTDWRQSGEPVLALTEKVQWLDDGPPKTPSNPVERPRRFYRIVEKED